MTKVRPPLTTAQAVTRIAGLIGWDAAARIVSRKERAVRLWSEPDAGGCPNFDQARMLDAAWRLAGGEGAPLLESYAFQLDVEIASQDTDRRELAQAVELASREYGEAVASAVVILNPAATPAQFHRALAEADQAHGAMAKLRRRITSFLPRGAAATKPGVRDAA